MEEAIEVSGVPSEAGTINLTVQPSPAPVKAMWICMVVAWALFACPIPGTVFVAGPVNLATIITAIVCIVRGATGKGIMGLVGATIVSGLMYLLSFPLMALLVAGADAASR